jgi:hypothetical protein
MDETGSNSAEEIKDKVPEMSQAIFNIIAEDIEEPHVPEDMKESSVKKHGTQKREILFKCCKMSREFGIGVSQRDNAIEIEGFFQMRSLSELPYKNKDIEANHGNIDDWKIL